MVVLLSGLTPIHRFQRVLRLQKISVALVAMRDNQDCAAH